MVISIIVVILIITIALSAVGAYIVVKNHNAEKEKEETTKILLSGKYSVALIPIAECLAQKKPSKAELEEWLNFQGLNEDQKNEYLENWQNSIDEIVRTINEGDINEVKAYQIIVGKKSEGMCGFLPPDNFVTREQITKNSEILPPYFFGCDCKVIPKLPTRESTWKPVVPKDEIYDVPNWRQMV